VTTQPKQPNILLIVSDQHRQDSLGHTSGYPLGTPRLDALAAQGVRFGSAYTPVPLCTPARQALLTGRRPETHGGLWNYDLGPSDSGLAPDQYAWPQALRAVGYRSRYFGKWHVSEQHDPTSFGYDEYLPLEAYEAFRRERHPDVEYHNGWFGEPDPVPLEDSQTHWLAGQACEAITELAAGDEPWHVRVDFIEPHLPCRPAKPFADLYPPETIPPWSGFPDEFVNKPYMQRQQLVNWRVEGYDWSDWAPIVSRYFAIISQLDDAIGRLLDTLDAVGAACDTIVIYTSDHGDMCGSHRMMDKHYVMYDDVVRVPLIVRWPGVAEPGVVRDDFVYNALDLPPTLTAAAGADPSPSFCGRSLLSLLGVRAGSDTVRQEVVSTYNGQQFGLFTQRMIRTRRWKYVWNATDVDELYDLEVDPDELFNRIDDAAVATDLQELRDRLHEILLVEGDRIVANPWMADQFSSGRKLASRPD
jgi:arylsulfatase A-like enzyme